MENQETNNVCVHKGGSNKILAIIAIILSIISITMSAFTLGKISSCPQMNRNMYTTRSTQNRTNRNNNRKQHPCCGTSGLYPDSSSQENIFGCRIEKFDTG